MSRCFESHHFISLLVQLPWPLQPSSFGLLVVYHHSYLLFLLRRTHCYSWRHGQLVTLAHPPRCWSCRSRIFPEGRGHWGQIKKRMTGNAKLSYWVSSSSKFPMSARRAAFVTFWLCKFVFGSHPHYAIKPLYFHLAIKIAAGVSLPLAPMFLGHLYVQLDILRSDESQAGSCHIVTTFVHSTIL